MHPYQQDNAARLAAMTPEDHITAAEREFACGDYDRAQTHALLATAKATVCT